MRVLSYSDYSLKKFTERTHSHAMRAYVGSFKHSIFVWREIDDTVGDNNVHRSRCNPQRCQILDVSELERNIFETCLLKVVVLCRDCYFNLFLIRVAQICEITRLAKELPDKISRP